MKTIILLCGLGALLLLQGCSTDLLVLERTDIVTATPEEAPTKAGAVSWLALIDVLRIFEGTPKEAIQYNRTYKRIMKVYLLKHSDTGSSESRMERLDDGTMVSERKEQK